MNSTYDTTQSHLTVLCSVKNILVTGVSLGVLPAYSSPGPYSVPTLQGTYGSNQVS